MLINEVLYELEKPLQTLEVAFKAIHALNTLYAPEAEQARPNTKVLV